MVKNKLHTLPHSDVHTQQSSSSIHYTHLVTTHGTMAPAHGAADGAARPRKITRRRLAAACGGAGAMIKSGGLA